MSSKRSIFKGLAKEVGFGAFIGLAFAVVYKLSISDEQTMRRNYYLKQIAKEKTLKENAKTNADT